jgi:UDP-glucose-4-epimerase GalE
MRILITGGAGYIGSHTFAWLVRQGHDVWALDNLSLGHRRAVPSERLVVADLLDTPRLAACLRELRIEAVVNFAALSLVGESVERPLAYYRNNVGGVISLLDAMVQSGVRRLVQSSTTAVFGSPAMDRIGEHLPKAAINPYGHSKAMGERVLEDAAAAHGLAVIALRYFNAAGACPSGERGEDHRPETHLIPLALEVAMGKRALLKVFGGDYPTADGSCVRDYVHVDDLAAAHALAIDKTAASIATGQFDAFNLGSGHGSSNLEVIESCRRVTGMAIPIRMVERRLGDPPRLVADSERARRELGWTPRYADLDSIIGTAWNWHRSRPNGFAD